MTGCIPTLLTFCRMCLAVGSHSGPQWSDDKFKSLSGFLVNSQSLCCSHKTVKAKLGSNSSHLLSTNIIHICHCYWWQNCTVKTFFLGYTMSVWARLPFQFTALRKISFISYPFHYIVSKNNSSFLHFILSPLTGSHLFSINSSISCHVPMEPTLSHFIDIWVRSHFSSSTKFYYGPLLHQRLSNDLGIRRRCSG